MDHAIRQHPEHPGGVRRHLARAKLRLKFGLPRHAVKDLRQALEFQKTQRAEGGKPQPDDPPPYAVLAQLGEATRVDGRDRLFSMKPGGAELSTAIKHSIEYFLEAIATYERHGVQNVSDLAWMKAHLAASYTARCLVGLSQDRQDVVDEAFALAEPLFREAIELVKAKPYAWAIRYLAFAHALRGKPRAGNDEPSDFERARSLLEELAKAVPDAQHSALNDSIAMLYSYSAFENLDAAKEGIEAALACEAKDSEAFRATYAKAFCLYAIHEKSPTPELAETLRAAIESATTHAADALSQASVILTNLAVMEALLDDQSPDRAIERANRMQAAFETAGIHPSMEALAMISRNAIWDVVKRQRAQGGGGAATPPRALCDTLSKKLNPSFDVLRSKFAAAL